MIVIRDLKSDLSLLPQRHLVLAMGNFDGLHLGHQAVIGRAVDIARQQEYVAAALTFRQHPRSVLKPQDPPLLLMAPEEKVRRIEQMGVEVLIYLDFTLELAALSPQEFVGHILCEELNVSQIVVGENFRFGKNRQGTPQLLRQQGEKLGFLLTVIPPVRIGDQVVSSTSIRRLLQEGKVREASVFLNRDYELVGRVVPGDGRGHQLGFPTANLETPGALVPADGVYAAWAVAQGKRFAGMVNIGSRPTFPGAVRAVEVHLFDFSGDLYGERLAIHFVDRVRSEQAFPSPEALIERLEEDRTQVLEILGRSAARAESSPTKTG